jgi:ubiquinone biosynthesis UbiH/UbiF/VisC/COQ6 family hydroxylase
MRFLEELGVWQHLERERLQAVAEMRIFGDAGGALRFSAYDSGLPELAWIGESSRIHQELWENLKRQHNVTLFCPAAPASLDLSADGVSLGLQDGRVLRARLVVGADGRESWVRRQAGIDASVSAYGERGVVANFECAVPHRATAFQWFRDDGILAWLPLPGNRMSMVWSAPDEEAERLLALDEGAFCETVAAAGGHALGALGLITPRAAFPLRLMRVESVAKERVALIGDAAHAIHPLSGHGINLGFQDAKTLAGVLAVTPAWRDIGELAILRGYARARAEEPFLMQYLTHGLNRLFSQKNPVLSALRNTGMNLTGSLPVLTNALTRYAANGRF